MIVADHAALYAVGLLTIGLAGLLARREIVARLVSLEIILAAALLGLVAAGRADAARPAPFETIGLVVIVLSLIAAAFGAALIAAPGREEEKDA